MRNSSLLFYGILCGSPYGLEIQTKIIVKILNQPIYETFVNSAPESFRELTVNC